ncbi:DUF1015 family protein [Nonomuraea purpurea]|uniref:DUF1015 family protein n=1 Tax=Nonomuraea purpurea TaxID=1849276 RepID=A0ABV8GD47_9ACTN
MGTPELPVPDGLVLRPFRGVRFTVEDPAKVTSPPYDLISDADVDALLDSHPNNVVRLILPYSSQSNSSTAKPNAETPSGTHSPRVETPLETRYTKARDTLRAWLDSGVLVPDDVPALYVYEQSGPNVLQRGLIGDVGLVDPGQGIILPHEDVVPGPIADRLALMSTTQANLEPIFLLYDGDNGTATRLVNEVAAKRRPLITAQTEDGLTHRIWAITDTTEIAAINADLHPRQALIADGHHRYATYRVLQRQERAAHRQEQQPPAPPPSDSKEPSNSKAPTTPANLPSTPKLTGPSELLSTKAADGSGEPSNTQEPTPPDQLASTQQPSPPEEPANAQKPISLKGPSSTERPTSPREASSPQKGSSSTEPSSEKAPNGTSHIAPKAEVPSPTPTPTPAPTPASAASPAPTPAPAPASAIGPWDFGLALLVDSTAYPPDLKAIHRVIPGLPLAEATTKARAAWRVDDYDDLAQGLAALEEAQEPAFLLAGTGGSHLLTQPDPVQLAQAMPTDHSDRWNSLNTSILTEFVLPKLWNMRDDEQAVRIVHHDTKAATQLAIQTGGTAVILKPLSPANVFAIAAGGERVPRKSTSFGPKPRTGLVLRTFAID